MTFCHYCEQTHHYSPMAGPVETKASGSKALY